MSQNVQKTPEDGRTTATMSAEQTPDELREQYEFEKEKAAELRRASRDERHGLYARVYNEFYRRFPRHALIRKSSPETAAIAVEQQIRFLRPFLKPETAFLELGPGDCLLSFGVARHVRQVFAVDVSNEITAAASTPPNFHLLLNDGFGIPVEPASIDIAYSTDFMEHLHPDDAGEQLHNVFTALKPGGVYVCITPHQLSGPHDISQYFDTTATGLHLKEYSVKEISKLFRQTGFSNLMVRAGIRGLYANIPVMPVIWCEYLLKRLPRPAVKKIVSHPPFRQLLSIIRLVAFK